MSQISLSIRPWFFSEIKHPLFTGQIDSFLYYLNTVVFLEQGFSARVYGPLVPIPMPNKSKLGHFFL